MNKSHRGVGIAVLIGIALAIPAAVILTMVLAVVWYMASMQRDVKEVLTGQAEVVQDVGELVGEYTIDKGSTVEVTFPEEDPVAVDCVVNETKSVDWKHNADTLTFSAIDSSGRQLMAASYGSSFRMQPDREGMIRFQLKNLLDVPIVVEVRKRQ